MQRKFAPARLPAIIRYLAPLMVVALAAALFGSGVIRSAHADTPVGCSLSDLTSAIADANAARPTPVTLSLAASCTYTVGSPYLAIDGDVTIEGNGATITGAIYGVFYIGSDGSLDLRSVTLSDNSNSFLRGGAIYNNGGRAVITYSTLMDNSAGPYPYGGAIYNNGGSVTISNSTLAHNSAGTDTIPGWGGAIYSAHGNLAITNSTLANNSATALGGSGGAIYNFEGSVKITNSTVANNSATRWGGAIANYGTAESRANIFDGNTATLGATCYGSAIADLGYNVEDDDSCGFSLATDKAGIGGDAIGLGPLQNNGGPTETTAIDGSSAAHGIIPANDCPTYDQRNLVRVRPGEPTCDSGAYELGASAPGSPPPACNITTLALSGQWTLVAWPGATMPVAQALAASSNGCTAAVSSEIAVIWSYDSSTQSWQAYFPGATAVGANDLTQLENGMGYFVGLLNPSGTVQWKVELPTS